MKLQKFNFGLVVTLDHKNSSYTCNTSSWRFWPSFAITLARSISTSSSKLTVSLNPACESLPKPHSLHRNTTQKLEMSHGQLSKGFNDFINVLWGSGGGFKHRIKIIIYIIFNFDNIYNSFSWIMFAGADLRWDGGVNRPKGQPLPPSRIIGKGVHLPCNFHREAGGVTSPETIIFCRSLLTLTSLKMFLKSGKKFCPELIKC